MNEIIHTSIMHKVSCLSQHPVDPGTSDPNETRTGHLATDKLFLRVTRTHSPVRKAEVGGSEGSRGIGNGVRDRISLWQRLTQRGWSAGRMKSRASG